MNKSLYLQDIYLILQELEIMNQHDQKTSTFLTHFIAMLFLVRM